MPRSSLHFLLKAHVDGWMTNALTEWFQFCLLLGFRWSSLQNFYWMLWKRVTGKLLLLKFLGSSSEGGKLTGVSFLELYWCFICRRVHEIEAASPLRWYCVGNQMHAADIKLTPTSMFLIHLYMYVYMCVVPCIPRLRTGPELEGHPPFIGNQLCVLTSTQRRKGQPD